MIKARQEASSEEFEFIPAEKEQTKEKDERYLWAEVTLIEFKYMIKEAEENEDILYGQNQRIALMLEDLDEQRLEEWLKDLEKFRE